MLTLGVDPGLTGAIALLDADGQPELVADLPVIRDGRLSWIDGGALQSMLLDAIQGRLCRAVVERVSAMPRQGIASAFSFGVGLGSILATLQTLQLPIELVTPAAWKASMGLGRDKHVSLDKARLLFPTADLGLAKHDGRAEALLLAYYAQSRASGGSMRPDPNLRLIEVPDTCMQIGGGSLMLNRAKNTDADPDLIGSIRFEGRVLRLRGWVIETDHCAHIRLTVQHATP